MHTFTKSDFCSLLFGLIKITGKELCHNKYTSIKRLKDASELRKYACRDVIWNSFHKENHKPFLLHLVRSMEMNKASTTFLNRHSLSRNAHQE